MKILYIDSTVREMSRTAEIARFLLERLLLEDPDGGITPVKLNDIDLPRVDEDFLRERDKACSSHDFAADIFDNAKLFAAADIIVIAAPYWDLSFPAVLKRYFEQINVVGLTFAYTDEGIPVSLCRAKKLYYVTSAGGMIYDDAFGFGYIKALAENFYGIKDCICFKAEGLDIVGADICGIMDRTKREITSLICDKTER